jgi:2'-5' RNA ligase
LPADRLHLSLQHVGDHKRLRPKFIYAAKQAGNAVSMPSFEFVFRFVKSLEGVPPKDGQPRRRPLVLLGADETLSSLHEALGAAMAKNGLRAAVRFTPHMTLSYGPQAVPLHSIEPIGFAVREFCLIHSEVGLARYHLVGRWPLAG